MPTGILQRMWPRFKRWSGLNRSFLWVEPRRLTRRSRNKNGKTPKGGVFCGYDEQVPPQPCPFRRPSFRWIIPAVTKKAMDSQEAAVQQLLEIFRRRRPAYGVNISTPMRNGKNFSKKPLSFEKQVRYK